MAAGNSRGRRILDASTATVGPFGLAVAEGIPVAGGPLKAAISGLLIVLNAVNGKIQNKEDAQELQIRLYRLNNMMATIPSGDAAANATRSSLISQLDDTSATLLQCLVDNSRFRHPVVSSMIKKCRQEIDSQLLDFMFLNSMQQSNRLYSTEIQMSMFTQRLEALERRLLVGSIQLVDATGHIHQIPMSFSQSLEQFKEAMRVCFQPQTLQGWVLRRYIDAGEYDLCFRHGSRVLEITDEKDWIEIQPGTTVTMSIILTERIKESEHRETYVCPFCKVLNGVRRKYGHSSLECLGCGRWFQITPSNNAKDKESKGGKGTQAPQPEDKLTLIRNIHVKQIITTSPAPEKSDNDNLGFTQNRRDIYGRRRSRSNKRHYYVHQVYVDGHLETIIRR